MENRTSKVKGDTAEKLTKGDLNEPIYHQNTDMVQTEARLARAVSNMCCAEQRAFLLDVGRGWLGDP